MIQDQPDLQIQQGRGHIFHHSGASYVPAASIIALPLVSILLYTLEIKAHELRCSKVETARVSRFL